MATAEQVLAMMEMNAIEHPYCIIDADSRKITVPDEYKLLGVESDENVERVYFKCPKIVGDGIDLSTLGLRINYQNANSQKDSYPVDDLTVENEFITFSWLLSRKAVAYKGAVKFIICAVRIGDNAEISNEWNTTLASAEVLEGLEVDYSSIPEEEGKDFLEALIAQSQVKLMEVVEATEEAKRSAERADTAAQEANAATERANKAAQDAENVVAGKGFIATSEKGIAGGVATLDESGQVPKEQIPDISEKTVTFEIASQRAGVESGDSLAVAFGKLAKYCVDLKDHAFADPVNNLLGTDPKLPLAATQGKALDEKIEDVKSDVTELNGNTTGLLQRELFMPGDTTNAPPNNKFLNISLKERFNAINRCHYFRQPNGTEFEGCPSVLKGKEFIGYRDIYWYSPINVMVQLKEFYPTPGRVWVNFYNSGTWTGWKSITPS